MRRDPEKTEELVLSVIILIKGHMKAPQTMGPLSLVLEEPLLPCKGDLQTQGAEGNVLPCSLINTDKQLGRTDIYMKPHNEYIFRQGITHLHHIYCAKSICPNVWLT